MRVSVTTRTLLTNRRQEEREQRRKARQVRIQRELASLSDEELDRWEAEIIERIEASFRAQIITEYERQSPEEREMTAERDARILQSPPLHLGRNHAGMSPTEAEAIMARMEAERRPQVLAEYLALPPKERRAEARKAAVDHEWLEAERQARLVGSTRG
jgi:hypothetical protein